MNPGLATGGQLGTYARAAGEVVHAVSEEGRVVRYAEAVVTLPASMGAQIDAAHVDVERETVVAALAQRAEQAKVILLVNPSEIVPRLSVLMLVDAPVTPPATSSIGVTAPEGFTLMQDVVVTPVVDTPPRTLTPSHVSHRVDALLAAPGSSSDASSQESR